MCPKHQSETNSCHQSLQKYTKHLIPTCRLKHGPCLFKKKDKKNDKGEKNW